MTDKTAPRKDLLAIKLMIQFLRADASYVDRKPGDPPESYYLRYLEWALKDNSHMKLQDILYLSQFSKILVIAKIINFGNIRNYYAGK